MPQEAGTACALDSPASRHGLDLLKYLLSVCVIRWWWQRARSRKQVEVGARILTGSGESEEASGSGDLGHNSVEDFLFKSDIFKKL